MFLHLLTVTSALALVTGLNYPPRLSRSCTTQVLENAAVGSLLNTLVIEDETPTLVTVKTVATTSDLVAVNNSRSDPNDSRNILVDIRLKTKLDRDYEPSSRDLTFEIGDASLKIVVKCTMFISDVNDEIPQFQSIPYRVTINESQPVHSVVYTVSASDPDSGLGSIVYYSMAAHAQDADMEYNTTFLVGKTNGSIILNKPLDYESRSYYQFLVHIEDAMGLKNDVPEPLVITIEDVQDSPPEFLKEPYMASISEGEQPGTSVVTVTAYDGDRGVPNPVVYSFVNDTYNKFAINRTTGVVTVQETLDADDPDVRARGGRFVMIVRASEVTSEPESNLTSATASVSITVMDENDNMPTFSSPTYKGSVAENSPRGAPISISVDITVEDKDQGENSRFRLRVLQGGQPFGGFTTLPADGVDVMGRTSVILVVGNSSLLDFEQRHNVTFTILAYETGSSARYNATAEVTVDIEDVNDNAPHFPPQLTSFNVSEDVKAGEIIGTVTATDADSGEFGELVYTLEDAQSLPFDVNATDGSIHVTGELDRERKVAYTLFVVATDTPGGETSQQRSHRRRVDVTVTDVNDNSPSFIGPSPQAFIAEDIVVNATIVALSATDPDSGENGVVSFSLATGTDPNGLYDVRSGGAAHIGVLVVKAPLLGHTGKHDVIVNACDGGAPPMCANRSVEIHVRDVNLNNPEFVRPNASSFNLTAGQLPVIEVLEEQPLGSVLYTLEARDADEGQNGAVRYFLDPSPSQDWQAFSLDRVTGNLTNTRRLDKETKETYQIQISAKDGGVPELVSTVTMLVKLLDIDDNPPSFSHLLPMPVRRDVTEEKVDVCVSVALAKDPDSNPSNSRICYFLLGGEKLDHFTLNKTTGSLCVVKKLDREAKAHVNLVIQALSNCSFSSQPSNGVPSNAGQAPPEYNASDASLLWLQLRVADINDQPPVFQDKQPVKGVLSDSAVGDEIFNLRDIVSDADEGSNAVTYFRLTGPVLPSSEVSGDPARLRTAFNVSVNGSVTVNMLFTANMLGHFTLPLLAFDTGNLNDTAQLKLFIISDIQRVRMTFRRVPDEVKRIQNELVSTMERILNFRIVVDKIASHEDKAGNVDGTKTDMFIHARYRDTGEVVPAWELARAFDFNQELNIIFAKHGVVETVPVLQQTSTEDPQVSLRIAFIAVALSLFLITVILVAVLINLRSRYQRKLRAATIKTPSYQQADGLQPGTNLYVEAASNPLFNKKVRLVEEDTNSQNSLDENAVEGAEKEEDMDEQELQMQFIDEVREYEHRQSSALDSVLNVYDTIKARDSTSSIDPAPIEGPALPDDHAPSSGPALSADPALPGQELGRVNPAFQDNDVIPNGKPRKFSLNIQSLEHTDL